MNVKNSWIWEKMNFKKYLKYLEKWTGKINEQNEQNPSKNAEEDKNISVTSKSFSKLIEASWPT